MLFGMFGLIVLAAILAPTGCRLGASGVEWFFDVGACIGEAVTGSTFWRTQMETISEKSTLKRG